MTDLPATTPPAEGSHTAAAGSPWALLRALVRFLVVGAVIHAALSWAFFQFLCPAHEAWRRDGWFLARDPGVKVVVCGGSHAFMAVNDTHLPAMLNIATHGEHYQRTLYRMTWLMDRRPEGLEAALVDFDVASFTSFKTDNFRPEAVWARYVPFLELARRGPQSTRYAGMWFRSRYAPYLGEADTVAQFLLGQRAFRGLGAGKADVQAQTAVEVAERHFPTIGDTWDPAQEQALKGIIALFKRHGVRVVLVSYPMHPAYTKQVQLRGVNVRRRHELLEEILEPGVVDHLDYEDLFGSQRLAFADPDHLSPFGSRALTLKLTKDLYDLGLRGQKDQGAVTPR